MVYLIIFGIIIFATILLNSLIFKGSWEKVATWIIAISAIAAVVISSNYYNSQISEMEKSRRFDWRPFLNIKNFDANIDYSLIKIPIPEGDSTLNEFDKSQYVIPDRTGIKKNVKESSEIDRVYLEIKAREKPIYSKSEIENADFFRFNWTRRIIYENVGETPLRITGLLSTAIYKKEWENWDKSVENLLKFYNDRKLIDSLEVDYIVFPNSTDTTNIKGIKRNIPREHFLDEFGAGDKIILYSVTAILYEDFFGNYYNTILIEHAIIEIEKENNSLIFPERSPIKIEKYRWDVGIE
jgi:hypothetical protein